MFGIGLPELVILLLFVGVPLAGAADAIQRPSAAFRTTGRSKALWIGLQVIGIFLFGLGLVAAGIYFLRVRPTLAAVATP